MGMLIEPVFKVFIDVIFIVCAVITKLYLKFS